MPIPRLSLRTALIVTALLPAAFGMLWRCGVIDYQTRSVNDPTGRSYPLWQSARFGSYLLERWEDGSWRFSHVAGWISDDDFRTIKGQKKIDRTQQPNHLDVLYWRPGPRGGTQYPAPQE